MEIQCSVCSNFLVPIFIEPIAYIHSDEKSIIMSTNPVAIYSCAAVALSMLIHLRLSVISRIFPVVFKVPKNSLTTKKQTIKFFVCKMSKSVKSKLYHIENSKTRGQTV